MKAMPYAITLLLFTMIAGMRGLLAALVLIFLIMTVGTIFLPRAEFPQGKFFHLSTWALACVLCWIAYYHFWGTTR